MLKNLTKHGNSLALIIEKPILELIGADHSAPFSITTDGRSLALTPVHDEKRRTEFSKAFKTVN